MRKNRREREREKEPASITPAVLKCWGGRGGNVDAMMAEGAGGGSVVFHQFSGSISMCRTTNKKKNVSLSLL